jgi:hypothetical protein
MMGAAAASPLQSVAAKLACGNIDEVGAALTALAEAPPSPFGLPDESLTGTDAGLRSALYDSLLDALANARRRFPALAPRIDRLLERWNFCSLTAGEERWDLSTHDGGVLRHLPTRISPFMGAGFKAWGLLPRRAGGRPRWQAPERDEGGRASGDDGDGSDAQSGEPVFDPGKPVILPMQCQPDHSLEFTPSGPLPMVPRPTDEVDLGCEAPARATAPAPDAQQPRVAQDQGSGAPPSPPPAATPPRSPNKRAPSSQGQRPRDVASTNTRESSAPLPGTIGASMQASASGTVGAGLGISVAPGKNIFVRTGLGWRLVTAWTEAIDLEPSWSWGVGYDDWHAGTVSLQLNHWGPLRRLGGVAAIKGATASLGYKIPLPKRLGRYLSARADLSTPLTWAPAAGAGVAIKLPWAMFFSVGASVKFADPTAPSWSYVLGRSKWTPGSLAVVLANYGPNRIPELNLKSISLSLSWSWKL